MRARISKSFQFQAAHRLPNVPPGHKCGGLHGHLYTVVLTLEGEIDPRLGWLVDFGEIKELCEPLRRRLDHACLNEIEGLANPTAELLAVWICERLRPALPQLVEVTVQESPTAAATYRPAP